MVFGYGRRARDGAERGALNREAVQARGAGSGMYGTTTQIGNAAGVAAIGAVFSRSKRAGSARWRYLRHASLFALSIIICAAFLLMDAARDRRMTN